MQPDQMQPMSQGCRAKLKRKLGSYVHIKDLGRGTFGVVTLRRCTHTEMTYAVKSSPMEGNGVPVTTLREAAYLKFASHVNIIKYSLSHCLSLTHKSPNLFCDRPTQSQLPDRPPTPQAV